MAYPAQPADLDEAVRRAHQAVMDAPIDHPQRAIMLSSLGLALQARYGSNGDPADLNRSINALRRAADAVMPGEPGASLYLSNLAAAIKQRYLTSRDTSDLDEAISLGRDAMAIAEPGDWSTPMCAGNLASALYVRFTAQHGVADLRDAVSAAADAVRSAGPDDPNWATYVDIATGLVTEVASLGDRWPDVEDAVRLSQATTAILDPMEPENVSLLAALQRLLLTKLRRQPDAATAYECVAAGKLLLERLPNDIRRAAVLSDIALAEQALFDVSGDIRALDEAIRTLQAAVDADPRNDWLSNLSNALRRRYERLGTLDDLDRAVQASRRAVEEAAADHPARAKHLSNLALALRMRYEHLGEPRDLDQAVETGRRAISSVAPDDPDRPMLLSNHSIALRVRYEALRRRDDLDEAVEAARTAVRLSDVHDRHRPGRLTNVSGLLVTRFLQFGAASDLDEALATGRESVSTTPAGDPRLPLFLSNVAAALAYHDEPEQAAERLRLAIELSPADHPDRAKYVYSRANILATPARHDDMLAEEVLAAWQDAALSTAASASVRLFAAHARAEFAAESGSRWSVASESYTQAAELLPLLVWRGLQRTSREALLSRWAGLPQDAVAAATESADPQHGLPSMEQSRAVLWSQLLDVRTDLQALHRAAPVLTAGLARVRAELEALDNRLGVRGDS
jgi:tetratricopeptide (TPR) repeat protein